MTIYGGGLTAAAAAAAQTAVVKPATCDTQYYKKPLQLSPRRVV